MSQEEYEKNPQTQTVQSADGIKRTQMIAYDDYKSLWEAQQTQIARGEVASRLEQTQQKINKHPERIKIAEKCHDFRVRLAESAVAGILKPLGRDPIKARTSTDENIWDEFSKMLNKEAVGADNGNFSDFIKETEEMEKKDPEHSALYEKMREIVSDGNSKHLNARA